MNQAVEYDLATRKSRTIEPGEAAASLKAGKSCWLDLDAEARPEAEALLKGFNLPELAIEQALAEGEGGRLVNHKDCLHVRVTAVTGRGADLRFARLDLILARELVVTIHRGPLDLLEEIRRTHAVDFERFAKSIGFMVYEVFDRIADGYRRAIRSTEAEVEAFQSRIFGEVDDDIFNQVALSNRYLLALRASLLAVRDVLHQLATRRSRHVSETTQPFLESILGALERLDDDLTIAREILSESLDLYMSLVSHRTNRVVTRLTVLSIVFLPLTFLCGVYGMNFRHQPELGWTYGYAAWWALALSIAAGLVVFMRRRRWL